MSRPLIIRPAAEDDLAEARAWYDNQREGLGDELLECVEEALDRIRRMPEAPAVLFEGVRRVLVRRFPYGVFYLVGDDEISVLAVYHSRRDPRGWQSRV
jgi:plasmid stabilization system protein ParE